MPWPYTLWNMFGSPPRGFPNPPTFSMPHYHAYPPHQFMPSFGNHTPFLSPQPQALMAHSNSSSSVN